MKALGHLKMLAAATVAVIGLTSAALAQTAGIETLGLNPGSTIRELNLNWYSGSGGQESYVRLYDSTGNNVITTTKGDAGTAPTTTANKRYHRVTLTDLTPSTKYKYAVSNDGETWSEQYDYTTPAESNKFKFAAVSDAQLDSKTQAVNTGASAVPNAQNWKNVVGKLNNHGVNFILHAGDQVDGTSTLANEYRDFFAPPSLRNIPFAPLMGNHDSHCEFLYRYNLPNEYDRPTACSGTETYVMSWSTNARFNAGNYYYLYNNILFIGLNTAAYPGSVDNATIHINRYKANIEAAKTEFSGKYDFIVVFHHKSTQTISSHSADSDIEYYVKAGLEKLMTENGVSLVLSGHDHVNVRSKFLVWDDKLGMSVPNETESHPTVPCAVTNKALCGPFQGDNKGTVYLTLSTASGMKYYAPFTTSVGSTTFPNLADGTTGNANLKQGSSSNKAKWLIGMDGYEYTQSPEYTIVEVNGNAMTLKTYSNNDDSTPLDEFTITTDNIYRWQEPEPDPDPEPDPEPVGELTITAKWKAPTLGDYGYVKGETLEAVVTITDSEGKVFSPTTIAYIGSRKLTESGFAEGDVKAHITYSEYIDNTIDLPAISALDIKCSSCEYYFDSLSSATSAAGGSSGIDIINGKTACANLKTEGTLNAKSDTLTNRYYHFTTLGTHNFGSTGNRHYINSTAVTGNGVNLSSIAQAPEGGYYLYVGKSSQTVQFNVSGGTDYCKYTETEPEPDPDAPVSVTFSWEPPQLGVGYGYVKGETVKAKIDVKNYKGECAVSLPEPIKLTEDGIAETVVSATCGDTVITGLLPAISDVNCSSCEYYFGKISGASKAVNAEYACDNLKTKGSWDIKTNGLDGVPTPDRYYHFTKLDSISSGYNQTAYRIFINGTGFNGTNNTNRDLAWVKSNFAEAPEGGWYMYVDSSSNPQKFSVSGGYYNCLPPPTDIAGAKVEVKGAYTYTGSAQVPHKDNVVVTLGDVIISAYTISATDNTNAGTATVTVIGDDKYTTGTASGKFEIEKAEGIFGTPEAITAVYNPKLTLADFDMSGYEGYKWDDPTTSLSAGDDQKFAATYTEPSGNYNVAEGEITVNVDKADPNYENKIPTDLTAVYGDALSSVKFPSPRWSWEDETALVGDAGTRMHTATYTPWNKNNYNTMTGIEIPVTVAKAAGAGTVAITGWTYGEVAVSPVTEGGTGDAIHEYKVQGADDETYSEVVPANAGSYTVRATFAETANYLAHAHTADFVIAKSIPAYEIPAGLTATHGDLLSSVGLSEGWSWEDETATVGNAGERTHTATYTPNDVNNYNVVSVDVPVTVAKTSGAGTVAITGWTFGEVAASPVTVGGTGDAIHEYKVQGADDDTYSEVVPVNAGSYTVRATFAASDNHHHHAHTADFVIAKAIPAYDIPADLTATHGDLLSSVELSEGWSWEDETAPVGNAGERTHKATYTPQSDNHHIVSEIDVPVTVAKAAGSFSAPSAVSAAYAPVLTLADLELPAGYVWNTPATALSAGHNQSFAATYTHASGNYTAAAGHITVNVAKAGYSVSGITFADATVEYDGNVHSILISGNLPSGVTVAYSGNDQTEVGEYTVTANFTVADIANYNVPPSKTAKLTIAKSSSVLTSDRVVPTKPTEEATVIAPVTQLSGEFTAGPNPVAKSSGSVNFYRQGKRVSNSELRIYDINGNAINKVKISDNAIGTQSRRQVGKWNLCDRNGRIVPEGTYLVKGIIKTSDGKSDKVSLILSVR